MLNFQFFERGMVMNKIVIYTSKTGFTKTYAQWIATELGCQAKSLKEVDLGTLKDYDLIVYGGWVMGGMIMGLDKVKKAGVNNPLVFATGMSAQCDAIRELILKQNEIDPERFFYLEGGYAPDKVGFVSRMMVKMVTRSVSKKKVKNEDELRMLETATGIDRTDKKLIEPLLNEAKEV